MSLARYREYKDSGFDWLGMVPAHWHIKRLRYVANLNPSKSELAAYNRSTEVSFLPMEAIGDDGSLNLDRTRTIAEVENGYTYFRDGDVTLAKITPCFENGKGALMQGLREGIGFGTTELIVARPNSSEVLGSMLNWIFRSPNFRKQGEASMYGAGGQKRVPDDFVRDFAGALPPIDEQVAIAAFLERETAKIDMLIAEQEKLIALLAEKREATISHAVTKGLNRNAPMKDSGIAWLGEIPSHWTTARLRHLTTQIVDGAHFTPTYVDEGVPFLRVTDITGKFPNLDNVKRIPESEHRELCQRCRPQKGDLLLSKNGTIGVPKIITWDWEFSIFVSLCLLKMTPEMSASFAAYVFESSSIKIQIDEGAKQSTVTNLHLEKIGAFRFPVPPVREQEVIVAHLCTETAKFDALSAEAERTICLLKERHSALITAAVTGQIDVRGTVVQEEEAHEAIAA